MEYQALLLDEEDIEEAFSTTETVNFGSQPKKVNKIGRAAMTLPI